MIPVQPKLISSSSDGCILARAAPDLSAPRNTRMRNGRAPSWCPPPFPLPARWSACRPRHVMVLRPVPKREVRAVGKKCRGEKLILDPEQIPAGPDCLGRLALVSGNAQLFVLQQIQLAACFVKHGDELRRFINSLVAESAAPRDRGGLRLAVQRTETSTVDFVIRIEFQFLRDVQMAVAPVESRLQRAR